jgi:hypothetical protein
LAMGLALLAITARSPNRGSSYLGEALESYQSTFLRIAGARNGLFVKFGFDGQLPVLLRLSMGIGFVLASYAWVLLIIMNQRLIYIELLSRLWLQF